MTSHLPSNEIELFRSLKKTAIVLVLLFRLDKPVGESEIARVLDIHPETTRIYLRSLARLGLVTRTHRFNGWTLTAGGRQMILGESAHPWPVLGAGNIKTSAEKPRSLPENPVASAENPRSLPEGLTASAENPRSVPESPTASAENPRSIPESPTASAENPRSTVECPTASAEKPRSTAEIPRSRPIAAASLSLSFKAARNTAAAARDPTSAEKPPSLLSRAFQLSKKRHRTAGASPPAGAKIRANLEAFASLGLVRNPFVSEICRMHHVTPGYILGQKERLEAERRYSPGLLLTVIRSCDHLPEKYLPRQEPDLHALDTEPQTAGDPDPIPAIQPDPSIHEPVFANDMTAAKAWSAILQQLKLDMPKAAYDKWVRDAVLLSARDRTLTIAAPDAYARDWLASRLSTTITRQLFGICNRSVKVEFVNAERLTYLPNCATSAIFKS